VTTTRLVLTPSSSSTYDFDTRSSVFKIWQLKIEREYLGLSTQSLVSAFFELLLPAYAGRASKRSALLLYV
jgi:hypothetical protein